MIVVDAAAPQGATQQQAVQQQAVPPLAGQQPAQQVAAQVPDGFQLNALQQAALDQVLGAWQTASGKIVTFRCPFERREFDVAFGPKDRSIPLNKNLGELSYHKPDKGSFQITEVNTFRAQPVPPNQPPPAVMQGDWVKQPDAIGEHWVCDGKSIYEYRHDQKLLVERPIPPQLQGQAIADGPLPFLFGADAEKLKQRYWMRIDQQNQDDTQVWINAKPKFQEQAANFSEVDVILDRQRLLPLFMQVQMPNGNRHIYIFHIEKATINGALDRVQAWFDRPRTPAGWKRVVENIPLAQTPQPVTPR